ncbi:lipase [Streptomyces sp. AC536]|uniref:alpha/beta hydrolase family protein n=1 Tax=Streptomyces buecherae TaxID=2763006 RepID=UPI00164D3C78|nr:lipase [Streptomyces buecherae]MBC3983762.1 lipase [Streptomyces buecherae]QNJ40842.1 lipase [Streptomyces buecherae]
MNHPLRNTRTTPPIPLAPDAPRASRSRPLPRRAVLGGVAAAGLAAALPLPLAAPASAAPRSGAFRFDLPAPTGPHPVGTTHLHLVDHTRTERWTEEPNRPRELMVSVWYPARAGADAPRAPYVTPGLAAVLDAYGETQLGLPASALNWADIGTHATAGPPVAPSARPRPVVLYTPGFQSSRDTDTVVVAELASHGFVVVSVDHTYEAMAVEFPDGRLHTISPLLTELPDAEMVRVAIATRTADLRFVVDQVTGLARGRNPDAAGRPLPRGLARAVDPHRIGGYGHSIGPSGLFDAMLADRRIRAGALQDGPLVQGGGRPTAAAQAGLRQPFLLMCGMFGESGGEPFHHRSPLAVGLAALWENSPGWKRDLWSKGAGHLSYTDFMHLLPVLDREFGVRDEAMGLIGSLDPAGFVATRRAYLTAFFTQHLLRRPQPLLDAPSPRYPYVEFID